QRSRTEPPHAPPSTSASAIPPLAGAGSARRTVAALLLPAPCSLLHAPAHVASRSRTAAVPQSRPATPMMPTAAPSGARRARHVQLGFLLVAVQSQLHQHFALGRGHVARPQAIEREHEDVATARLAAAEPGQLGTQLRILPLQHFERHVRHPTTASSPPCTRPSGT